MEKRKIPAVRFKGFEDDWEQCKLNDVAKFSKGNGYSKGDLIEAGTPIILYGRLYTKYETTISDVDTFVVAKDGSVYSKGGEVIVPASGETAEDIARAATVDKPGILLGGDLNVVMPNEEINSAFLAISISNGSSQRELAKKAQGKSVVHIHNEEIRNLVVPFPTKAEQNKIVDYFANLDSLITLHQRKLEKLQLVKKSMLEKMFPKNGSKIPEIRFEGFADDWEQRKLGEVTQKFKSGNSLKADKISESGAYPVYGGNGLRGYTSTYNHEGEFALIGRQGALCGNMNYFIGKAYFTEHAVAVEADENNNTRFMYYMLDTMNLGQYSDQSAQPGLAVNKLIKLENMFPKKEEQIKIENYFQSIDHLITLHQRKLEKMKSFKKSLLEKLFVQ
ncbi:MAG: restriction endonuclease subunit S [Clostridium sp.]